MRKSSILLAITLTGSIFLYVLSPLRTFLRIFPILIGWGFIAGIGFSIAVLIVQYIKNHVRWK